MNPAIRKSTPLELQERYNSIPLELRERYKESIEATKKTFAKLPTHKQVYLVGRLIAECEAARKYDWKKASDIQKRDLDAIKGCEKIASSSRKLASALKRYQNEFAFALAAASLETKTAVVDRGAKSTRGDINRLSDLLSALEGQVRTKGIIGKLPYRRLPTGHKERDQKVRAHSALVLERAMMRGRHMQFGPLHFPKGIYKPIKQHNVVLAIYLMALVRSYETSDIWGIQAGDRFPKGPPKARWSLIEIWVAEALGRRNSANLKNSAEASISRHPELEILGYD